jgi:hypothetical protein
MCDWTNAMNHFEYLWETSDDVLTNDDKQHTYKGRGGIDMGCYPFDLRDKPWEALVKCLASSNEDNNQASSLLLTKISTSKEISKDTLIASISKNDISTVQAYTWHQANINKDFVCLTKGMNLSQCGYLDGNCSLLVHRECAIECYRAVGIVYTLEDRKSAKCPNHHNGFKKKINSFWEIDNNGGNSDEIDQRSDSNKGSGKKDSSDEGQKDDEWTKEKEANFDGDDEESGKDGELRGLDKLNPVAI